MSRKLLPFVAAEKSAKPVIDINQLCNEDIELHTPVFRTRCFALRSNAVTLAQPIPK